MAEHVIEIRGLHKAFGSHEVLKGIDFTASKGEVVCIIGSSDKFYCFHYSRMEA